MWRELGAGSIVFAMALVAFPPVVEVTLERSAICLASTHMKGTGEQARAYPASSASRSSSSFHDGGHDLDRPAFRQGRMSSCTWRCSTSPRAKGG
jgi:hypothetical protein